MTDSRHERHTTRKGVAGVSLGPFFFFRSRATRGRESPRPLSLSLSLSKRPARLPKACGRPKRQSLSRRDAPVGHSARRAVCFFFGKKRALKNVSRRHGIFGTCSSRFSRARRPRPFENSVRVFERVGVGTGGRDARTIESSNATRTRSLRLVRPRSDRGQISETVWKLLLERQRYTEFRTPTPHVDPVVLGAGGAAA